MDFYRVEHPTIMSGLVVRYREMGADALRGFEISASRDGVMCHGESLRGIPSKADVQDMEAVFRRADAQHQRLRVEGLGSRQTSLPFTGDPPCVIEWHKAYFGQKDEVVQRRPRSLNPAI